MYRMLRATIKCGQLASAANLQNPSNKIFCKTCAAAIQRSTIFYQHEKLQHNSALYVRRDDKNATIVNVDLNLDERFADITKLRNILVARGIDTEFNIYEMVMRYKDLQVLKSERDSIQNQRQDLAENITHLEQDTDNNLDEITSLRAIAIELRTKFKSLQNSISEVEDFVMLQALHLPTDIHTSTPDTDKVIEEISCDQADIREPQTHMNLAAKTRLLAFSALSCGSVYIKGSLAHLKMSLTDQVSDLLLSHQFVPLSGPNLYKSIALEGTGEDFDNPQNVYTLQLRHTDATQNDDSHISKVNRTFHLAGSASSTGFAAYLAKMNIKTSRLPNKYYCIGQQYTPSKRATMTTISHGLLACPQKYAVDFCIVAEESDCYSEYQAACDILWELCKSWNIPIRQVQMGQKSLQRYQSARTEIQAWLPGLQQYVTISEVSLNDDFISRRLLMKSVEYVKSTSQDYVHTIHGQALNITNVLAAFMENKQTQDGLVKLPFVDS